MKTSIFDEQAYRPARARNNVPRLETAELRLLFSILKKSSVIPKHARKAYRNFYNFIYRNYYYGKDPKRVEYISKKIEEAMPTLFGGQNEMV